MTLEELYSSFDNDVREIKEECEREGYPLRGSNFDLRYEQLVKLYEEREKILFRLYRRGGIIV